MNCPNLLKTFITLIILFTSSFALANEFAIIPQHIFDPLTGEYHKDFSLIIRHNKIAAWVRKDKIHPHTPRIVLPNLTLMPGLIDLHTHINVDNYSSDQRLGGMMSSPYENVRIGLENAKKTLLAGFTTIRNLATLQSSIWPMDIQVRNQILKGNLAGPRIIPAGHPISLKGSHCDPGSKVKTIQTGFQQGVINTPESAEMAFAAVEKQIKNGSKWIKVCLTPGALTEQKLNVSEVILTQIVQHAKDYGVQVAVHAISSEGIRAAVNSGVSTIEHAHELTKEDVNYIKNAKWKGYIIPTLSVTEYVILGKISSWAINEFGEKYLTQYVMDARSSIKLAIQSDLPIAFGSDAGMFPHGDNALEFVLMQSLGLPPLKVIQSATTTAAKVLKIKTIGNLSPGSYADLIGVEGNPLDDLSTLRRVKWVMKGGQVFKTNK